MGRGWAGCVLAGLAIVLLGGGCVSPVTLSDEFGASVEQSKQAQRLLPEASAGTDYVDGLDGRASERSLERYLNSFPLQPAAPPPAMSGGSAIVNPGSVAQ